MEAILEGIEWNVMETDETSQRTTVIWVNIRDVLVDSMEKVGGGRGLHV